MNAGFGRTTSRFVRTNANASSASIILEHQIGDDDHSTTVDPGEAVNADADARSPLRIDEVHHPPQPREIRGRSGVGNRFPKMDIAPVRIIDLTQIQNGPACAAVDITWPPMYSPLRCE